MNPTGGIVGPGNVSIFNGDMNDPLVCHAIVHDACGYLTTYHKTGPGYNYLNVCSIFSTSSPLCCQFEGWRASSKIMDRWHMRGKRGRNRRQMFMKLTETIPELQSHGELELRRNRLNQRHTIRHTIHQIEMGHSIRKKRSNALSSLNQHTLFDEDVQMHAPDIIPRSKTPVLEKIPGRLAMPETPFVSTGGWLTPEMLASPTPRSAPTTPVNDSIHSRKSLVLPETLALSTVQVILLGPTSRSTPKSTS